jgi:16S rRNA (uracil1498-N3)-methyltransferase
MRRRFIADTRTATTATLLGDQARHLAHVLRAAPGQVYDIVADGFLHRAEIVAVSDHEVLFTLHEELEAPSTLPVHLLLAIFKFDHMEWAIEKATELGVARITPILARRTEKHLALAAPKRADRWRRIALEASKQSRRTNIPQIADPQPLKAALAQETTPHCILLSETEQATTLTAVLTAVERPTGYESVARNPREQGESTESGAQGLVSETWYGSGIQFALAIGPEGGWTPEEMALFAAHRWRPVTLGPRILRAETAAIAAIAILSAHLL